jgi:glycosyltransferase involved in cell wall biosynthesis
MQPDVSVVIPTYNREEYLRKAIASCFEGNENVDVEVVVVDDGSTDGTREYLEELDDDRVRPIFQAHQGGQVARSWGLKEARGEYVKFLDDDDWLASGALRKEVETLEQTGTEVCSGGYRVIDEQKRICWPPEGGSKDFLAGLLRGEVSTHPLSLTYQRELISHHEWDPDLVGRQDVQFAVDVALEDPSFACLNEVIATKRNHEGNQQKERGASKTDLSLTHAKILQRAVRTLEEEDRLTPERRRTGFGRGRTSWLRTTGPPSGTSTE